MTIHRRRRMQFWRERKAEQGESMEIEMVEVKTAELVSMALDWAVALATGWEADRPQDGQIRKGDTYALVGRRPRFGANLCLYFSPSTDWAQGGPLLDEFDIAVNGGSAAGKLIIHATVRNVPDNFSFATAIGDTRLIAACRAIVSAKLGDVVQVPKVLAS